MKKKPTRKSVSSPQRGRPTKRTPAVEERILAGLAAGETLSAICREEGMPNRRKVSEWRQKDEEFSARVARARDDGFECIAEECLSIADNTEEEPASRKVRTEIRLKLLACWDPTRYGPKIDVKQHQTGEVVFRIGGDA